MPSGAKKRKAAKKKKEKEANINASTTGIQGNDELKSRGEKGSDGEEANSPAYHDHDSYHHPFNEGDEKVEERDHSDGLPSLDVKSLEEVSGDIKSREMVGGDDDAVVSTEKELKSEGSSNSKNENVKQIDTANHCQFSEGEEEVDERYPSDIQPSLDVKSMEEVTSDIKSGEMVEGDHDGVVSIDQKLKSEESSDSKNVTVEHIDTVNYHPFNEGDEAVGERDPSDALPSLDVKFMEEVTGDIKSGEMVGGDDGVVSIDQELKSEESFDRKNVTVEYIDTANHHLFNERDEKVEERDLSDAQPSLDVKSMEEVTGDIKNVEMVGGDDYGVVSIEQELKSEEISDSKSISVKHIDTANHHPFNEGDGEVEERDPSDVQPSLDVKSIEEVPGDIKSGEMVGGDHDGVVSTEQELKSEESSDSKNVSVEHIDVANHHPFNEGNKEVGERDILDAQPFLDVKSTVDTSAIKSGEIMGGDDDGVVSIEQELKSKESSDRKNVSVKDIDTANGSYHGDKNSDSTSNDKSITEKNLEDPPLNATRETITSDDLVKLVNSSPSKTTMITENAPAIEIDALVGSSSIVNSLMAVTSVSEVKRSDAESALIEKSVAPAAATNLAMKKNEDIVYPLSEENIRTSRLEEDKPKECDSEVPGSLSSSPLIAKDSETRESSADQPLVASAPRMVQRTSWLSCCGLLEALLGSK